MTNNVFIRAACGAGAGAAASFAVCPTELVKCRLQASSATNIGPYIVIKQILKQDGMLGLFRGLVATMLREIPGYFFFFGGYESSKYILKNTTQFCKTENDVVCSICCGGFAGWCLWISVFPFDVVKSRMQVEAKSTRGSWKTLTDIGKKEGIKALYKGLGPTLLRTFPATGALFLSYETARKFTYENFNLSTT